MGIGDVIDTAFETIGSAIEASPLAAVGIGTAVGVAAGTAGTLLVSNGSTTKKKKRSTTKRGRSRDRRFKSKQKHEKRYKRKRKYKVYGKKGWINPKKKKSSKKTKKKVGKVYYTKNGQPYKILRSGKARFIKGKRRKSR